MYSEKRWKMVDNFKTIKCPACQKEMHKIFVPSEGINVDVCVDGCGGVYFDNREYKQFDEQHENIDEICKALEGKEFIKVDGSLPRTCPVCGARMVKNHTSVKQQIQIDECYSCGGKFLDRGELINIRSEYVTEEERSADVVRKVYDTVGYDLKMLELNSMELKQKRSVFKRLFDKLILG